MFDVEGRVLGVCVPLAAGDDEIAGVEWYDSGIGFAVDADLLARRVPRLQNSRDVQRGFMGVTLDMRDRPVGATGAADGAEIPTDGVRLLSEPRGPAAAAGLRKDDVIRPDGRNGTHTVVRIKPGVSVLAIDSDRHVHLTDEFHYAIGRHSLEAVSGGTEPGETSLETAQRELREELGIDDPVDGDNRGRSALARVARRGRHRCAGPRSRRAPRPFSVR